MGTKKNRSSISSLPMDLIVDDILSRLPVKSLSRFKCVSKEWLNLISSPYFKCLHTQKNYQRKPFLFLWNPTEPDYRPQSAHYSLPRAFVVEQPKTGSVDLRLSVVDVVNEKLHHEFDASVVPLHVVDKRSSAFRRNMRFSHNVVCCRSLVFFWRRFSVCVCNPSINEFVKLPPDSFRAFRDFRSCVFGFGYNPPTNEYNIVAWVNRFGDGEEGHGYKDECLVFTLTDGGRATSGSWRRVKLRNRFNMHLGEHSVCVNGTIYWVVEGSNGLNSATNDSGYKSMINAFDLESEESNVIGCPFGRLVELKGKLCSAENLRGQSSIKIWMLEDPKNGVCVEEWKIHLPAPTPDPSAAWSANLFFPIAYYRLDGEEHLILKSWHDGLLYYNINTKRVRKADKLMSVTCNMGIAGSLVYWDGFFSLGT